MHGTSAHQPAPAAARYLLHDRFTGKSMVWTSARNMMSTNWVQSTFSSDTTKYSLKFPTSPLSLYSRSARTPRIRYRRAQVSTVFLSQPAPRIDRFDRVSLRYTFYLASQFPRCSQHRDGMTSMPIPDHVPDSFSFRACLTHL